MLLSSLTASEFQRETMTTSSEENEYGGFGGPIIKVTHLGDNDAALMIGGKGAFLINHTYYVGGAMYALVCNDKYQVENEDKRLGFGYGGLIAGYNFYPSKVVHFNTQLLLGGSNSFYYDDNTTKEHDLDRFHFSFASEVEVNAVFNVAEHFNINLGVGYRYVGKNGVLSSADLSGYTLNLAFIFGEF